MHVLQVAWEYPPRLFGGLGRHVEGLTAELAAADHRVTVLTPSHDGPEVAPPGVSVLRAAPPRAELPADRWLAATLDAGVAMAERALTTPIAPDVLHVHDWMAGHAARVLAPALGIPVVATIHATERGRHMGHLPPGFSAWIDAQERALVALADRVVVCAAHMVDHVATHLGADPARTTVIRNGVALAPWRSVTPRSAGRLPRVVFAGRLEHEKGVHVLLAAAKGLPCEVVIAGRGSQGPQLRRTAPPGVRFDGHLDQPQLAALLRSAAVAVIPSLYEPFGLAALEAMAAGTPLVASDVDGLAEVVTGGSGLLVPPGDPIALSAAIRRVLEEPSLAGRLRRAGTDRAAELSWATAAASHAAVYADVVSPR